VNYDLPNVPEAYVHRIGRTARAGAEGIAISLCDGDEVPFLRDIEKLIRQQIPATDRRTEPAGAPRPILQRQQRGQRPRQGSPQHVTPLRTERTRHERAADPARGRDAPRPQAERPRDSARPRVAEPAARVAHPRAADPAQRPAQSHAPRRPQEHAPRPAHARGGSSDAGASLAGLGFLSTRRRGSPGHVTDMPRGPRRAR
jgi:ATP-dependent RNA helicase RhlE